MHAHKIIVFMFLGINYLAEADVNNTEAIIRTVIEGIMGTTIVVLLSILILCCYCKKHRKNMYKPGTYIYML